MADPVSGAGSSGSVSSVGSLGTCTSVNFLFAKLQMELAATAKVAARDHISQIEKANAEQKEVADMLQRCRELQNQADRSGECTNMPADVQAYMDKNGLAYDKTGNDNIHNKDECPCRRIRKPSARTPRRRWFTCRTSWASTTRTRRARIRPSSPLCRRSPPCPAGSSRFLQRAIPAVPIRLAAALCRMVVVWGCPNALLGSPPAGNLFPAAAGLPRKMLWQNKKALRSNIRRKNSKR